MAIDLKTLRIIDVHNKRVVRLAKVLRALIITIWVTVVAAIIGGIWWAVS